jgi:hypothetical protein
MTFLQKVRHYLFAFWQVIPIFILSGCRGAVSQALRGGEYFLYWDIFIHYRYLHEPEKTPVLKGKPVPRQRAPGIIGRAWREMIIAMTFLVAGLQAYFGVLLAAVVGGGAHGVGVRCQVLG